MYESRFGITGPPFQLTPDPDFYFDSQSHHQAMADLRQAFNEDAALIVISGEVGAGKTTLIRTLIEDMDAGQVLVAQVVSTQLAASDLLRSVLIAFAVPADGSQAELATRLLRFLLKVDKEARSAVLIIDEAQNLHLDAFQQIGALASRRPQKRLPLHICLVGQPELRTVLESADLLPLRQLVSVSCHLGPIPRAQTRDYIEHRLRKVGWNGLPSFEPDAFDEIFRWTDGIPRRINLLCNRLMLSCFLASSTTIDRAGVSETARLLRNEIGDTTEEPAVLPEAGGEHKPAGPSRLPARADVHLSPPTLRSPLAMQATGAVLCVAVGCSDHIRAAALMRAMHSGARPLPARLVRVCDNDALAVTRALFSGLAIGDNLTEMGLAEGHAADSSPDLEEVFGLMVDESKPQAVVVFAGSAAALACSTAARTRKIPVISIGAGLFEGGESYAAGLADLVYTTDLPASQALEEAGVPVERTHCVGNLLVDAMQTALRIGMGPASQRVERLASETLVAHRYGYALVVLNQSVNTGNKQTLVELLHILSGVSRDLPLAWPIQPTLQQQLKRQRLERYIDGGRIVRLPAQPYAEYLMLLRGATCVLTDSWNTQEEATILGVPCLTIGHHPERAITTAIGSNVRLGTSTTAMTRAIWECIFNGGKRGQVPELWDGKTGARIVKYLCAWLASAEAEERSMA